ncbi:hypothetical protein [Mitsuaria sp. GD03876]|uniref:hypothetical protein n=1 Tax=Mitsuaria sp. GD03876 TaxID=2975399 RepID=UPI00244BCD8B|nr:hypothetical protein [Mitsuaria sp. GD03876]MDH0864386.1 hypothetical protein [Mitsuaria sp. GD03876]
MTRQAKKDLERRYLDRVRDLLADFPQGAIDEREQPDFLVNAADRIIGIEITELHRAKDSQPVPMQGREAIRHQIVQRAKVLYDGEGAPPIDCCVHLKDLSYRRKDIEPLAAKISELAKRNVPPEGTISSREQYDWVNRDYFPEEVDYIRVARFDGLTESFFGTTGSTWAEPMTSDIVGAIIDTKDANIVEYLRQCDEAWLVIVTDSGTMSTWFNSADQVETATFRTGFARVFILRNFGSKLIELTTART